MKTYTLHRINLFFVSLYGCVIGTIISFPIISFIVISIRSEAKDIQSWLGDFTIEIPSPFPLLSDFSINFLPLLKDLTVFQTVENLSEMTWMGVVLRILIATLITGFLSGLFAFFCGIVFNLLAIITGGLKIGLTENPSKVREVAVKPKLVENSQKQTLLNGPRLEITSPVQRVIPITAQETIIGSSPECGLQLDGLLPRHATLSYENGRYILRDFSQGNTLVKGRVINGLNMVADGFLLQIGSYKMTFRY